MIQLGGGKKKEIKIYQVSYKNIFVYTKIIIKKNFKRYGMNILFGKQLTIYNRVDIKVVDNLKDIKGTMIYVTSSILPNIYLGDFHFIES